MIHSRVLHNQTAQIAPQVDHQLMECMVVEPLALRGRGGRLVPFGVSCSAASGSHAVNDFRKFPGIETYSPRDNVSELTAHTNEQGRATAFEAWREVSQANSKDAIFVMPVGSSVVESYCPANGVRVYGAGAATGKAGCACMLA
jgi:D-sedoheptulose 7-phosphate isomerase